MGMVCDRDTVADIVNELASPLTRSAGMLAANIMQRGCPSGVLMRSRRGLEEFEKTDRPSGQDRFGRSLTCVTKDGLEQRPEGLSLVS